MTEPFAIRRATSDPAEAEGLAEVLLETTARSSNDVGAQRRSAFYRSHRRKG